MSLISLAMLAIVSVVCVAFLYLAKIGLDMSTPYDDNYEVIKDGNLAASFRRIGWYLAMAFAVAGSISSFAGTHFQLLQFAMDLGSAIILLILVSWVNDKLIMPSVDNHKAIRDNNTAVGLVELGSYLATGLIFFSSYTGEGGGTLSAIIFTILGQIALLVTYKVYDYLIPADIATEVEKKNNCAAAVAAFGKMVSLGIILAASIAGPFTGWVSDIVSFLISAATAMVFLIILEKVVDVLFIPKVTISDEINRGNVASVTLAQGIAITVSIVVAAVIVCV